MLCLQVTSLGLRRSSTTERIHEQDSLRISKLVHPENLKIFARASCASSVLHVLVPGNLDRPWEPCGSARERIDHAIFFKGDLS
jgi:hypothetical protein